MKRAFLCSTFGVAGVAAFLSVAAARYQPTVRPNTFAGPIALGGLTKEEAAKRLRIWWEDERVQKIEITATGISDHIPAMSPTELGMRLDDLGTVASLPLDGLIGSEEAAITSRSFPPEHHDLLFKSNLTALKPLAESIKALVGKPHLASVDFVDGQLVKTPETASVELNVAAVPNAVATAIHDSAPVELPLRTSAKHVPDQALDSIQEIVSEFSTHFPASNRPRSSNIRLASQRISGRVLMPGDLLSFNEVVGRRTIRGGFQLAGVYKNGKHDTGIGGGICQVSTTLYNASLLANLHIKRRSNHSMPVAYVPLGRDATVDYGNLDLVIQNNYKTPIAVVSHYEPGRLTFQLFGTKDPDLMVKITTKPGKSDRKPAETKMVYDPTLPKGVQKVIEPGSIRRSILTYRKIFRGGKLVDTQSLGKSFYGGGIKIIAIGTGAPKPVKPTLTQAKPPMTPQSPDGDTIGG